MLPNGHRSTILVVWEGSMIRSSKARACAPRALGFVMCVGMACTPVKYSIAVQTGPRQFRAEWLAVNMTQAWNPDALKAGGLLVPDLEHRSSAVTFVAAGLELYTFFMPEFPQQPFRTSYSRLPALATSDSQPRSYTLQTPYVVQALRVIDRGNCALRVPWVSGAAGEDGRIAVASDASQVFPAIDHAIQDQIHNTPCKDPNDDNSKDCTSISRVSSEYQALFTQRDNEWNTTRRDRTAIPSNVSYDGFALHLVQRFHGNTFLFMLFPIYGSSDADIHAEYAFGVGNDGFLGVTGISVEVGMKGDDTAGARAKIAEKFRQDLPRELVAAIRRKVSIPIILTDDAPGDAWCQEPVQGRTRSAGILAGMTATKLGGPSGGRAQAADQLISRLDPARFVMIEGEDHKRRCYFVPQIKRVNVLPGEFDLVMENSGEINATGELYSLLAPPENLWCGQAMSDGKRRLPPLTEKVLDGRVPIYAPPVNPVTGY
jgi:hypothetical protein